MSVLLFVFLLIKKGRAIPFFPHFGTLRMILELNADELN